MDEADHANNIFMVERLVDRRWRKGRSEYLVKWLNYDPVDNTWEPRANINHLLCDQFDAEHGGPLTGPISKPSRTSKTPQKRKTAASPAQGGSTSGTPAKRTRKSKEEVVPTPPSSRRSTRSRRGNADSVTTESIEPTPTPEPTSDQIDTSTEEPNTQASTSEPVDPTSEPVETPAPESQPPPANPVQVPIVEEPVEAPKVAEPIETEPEKVEAPVEEPIVEQSVTITEVTTIRTEIPPSKVVHQAPHNVEEPPESFMETDEDSRPHEQPTQPQSEPEKQSETYSYIIPGSQEAEPEMLHVYEGIPQSGEVPVDESYPYGNNRSTVQTDPSKPVEAKNGESNQISEAYPNGTITEVTVNSSTVHIVEI